MIRRPADLEVRSFDVIIVGGGVLGAFTAWDSALRGLAVALVEGEDFGGATTSNSLRIVHGGLRYLPRLDLPRMRASLGERAAWLRIAPHLVEPLPVLVPFARRGLARDLFRKGSVAVANALSWDRNRDVPGMLALPPARLLDPRECVARIPQLEGQPPAGGILFHDTTVRSPERMVLEVVKAAVQAGAVAANHVSCRGPLTENGRRVGIVARDQLSGDRLEVRGRVIANCAGPAAHDLSQRLTGRPVARGSIPSLALNLVLPGDGTTTALALDAGGRRLLRVPWQDRVLVGTLHLSGTPSSLPSSPDHSAVAELLSHFNAAWPGPPVSPAHVLAVHAGLLPARPTGARDRGGPVRLTRRSRIRVLEGGEGTPVIEAETLNLTLARLVAESLTDRIFSVLDRSPPPSLTKETVLPGAPAAQLSTLEATARRDWGEALPEGIPTRLARTYGAAYPEVMAHLEGDPEAARRIAPEVPAIGAQLRHGAASEMACTVQDLLHRRMGLGYSGPLPEEAHAAAARELARMSRSSVGPDETTSGPDEGAGGSLVTWLVDAHVHVHPFFNWGDVLTAVTGNLARAESNSARPLAAACLLLAEVTGSTAVERLRDESAARELLPPGWRIERTGEEASVRITPEGKGLPILLVDGRQVVTAEGVEVLALCSRQTHAELDGRPLSETIQDIRSAGGIPVLPWGFGKWWGRRGRLVREMVERLGVPSTVRPPLEDPPVFLGDNGNRPTWTRRPVILRKGEESGLPVLAGSDPLPFPRHADRVASSGFFLTGPLDPESPLASVGWTLRTLRASPPAFGSGTPWHGALRDQVGMQVRRRRSTGSGYHQEAPAAHVTPANPVRDESGAEG